ncbi:malonyl-ACP O-methyltransferase BioC [Marinospirillum insulare]|uniref:Malonyl-[acyl-carrier protein] O-methyltransferase n=1 Tax=Marinospirillum insulare TaxID=217169 RepID=A0ABQ6A079_9GAMM|nr:malonyl-ACP O-methyltransferase BioC [Marinospirillum insulare]GLR64988.1 malonyl-[acyl-carrier protein] O-methyltransferase [Marinospirillum insulare]
MFKPQEKQRVAASFSQAATTYDSFADLQRAVGTRLLSLLPEELLPEKVQQPLNSKTINNWLDLGCGTGHFAGQLQKQWPKALGIGLDLAEGMLQFSRLRYPPIHYLCADAEHLPLADNSQDLIFSSLALQWCPDFSAVLNEIKRVLKPGGLLLFSSIADGSLVELNKSWQAVDAKKHVNQFRTFKNYTNLVSSSDLEMIDLHCYQHIYHYEKVRDLTHELKYLGANHIQTGRAQGLVGRKGFQRFLNTYETYRQPQGLPATWQVVYGVLRKGE